MNCFHRVPDVKYVQARSISSAYLIILDLTFSNVIVWAFTESAYKDTNDIFVAFVLRKGSPMLNTLLRLIKKLLYLPQVL
jgi:hypothetical protein